MSSASNPESLPEFASEWMRQWKNAAIELPKVRAAELRRLRPVDALDALAMLDLVSSSKENPYENGLVIQQSWFMRNRLLQIESKEPGVDGTAQTSPISR